MPTFEAFWARYPRKVGKLAALKAWDKLKPDTELAAQIIDSIEAHRGCRAWRDGYIPHPRTYLTQGRWMDELDPNVDFYRARL